MQKLLHNQSSLAADSARLTRRRMLQAGVASALTLPAWLALAACEAPSASASGAGAPNQEANAARPAKRPFEGAWAGDSSDVAAGQVKATATPKAKVKIKATGTAKAASAPTAAPTVAPTDPPKVTATPALLPTGPLAPAVESATWLNTKPLAWDSLRGQVVMVEFWTFGCYNCQNVLPLMKSIYADYKDRGFTLVSVHSPEFDYEKQLSNVKDAVKRAGIAYPVAIDNDFANWRRYRNEYWPARYVVDKRGIMRFSYIGEGGEAETRSWVETLLAE